MEETLRALQEREEVLDVVNDLFVGTDDRDWDRVRDVLAPRVLFDVESMTGSEPETLDAADIVARWEEGLRPIRAVHHQTGNFRVRVSGDEADVFCYGTATHYRPTPSGRNTRTFVGSYDFHLLRSGDRWRIDVFRLNLKYVDGNLELEKEG